MRRVPLLIVLAAISLAGCRSTAAARAPQPVPAAPPQTSDAPRAPRTVQPGAPGEASRTVASSAAPVPRIAHTAADVAFMQGMIGHHAQALEMTELLKTRSENPDMKLLALRIEVSQTDEIRFMQRWLGSRGLPVPGPHAHHAHDAKLMPGMLTPADMAQLSAARGAEFDRLFLAFMIRHHDGALVMVDELFEADGAGQGADINAFASDIVADQKMEMDRMGAMLRELQK